MSITPDNIITPDSTKGFGVLYEILSEALLSIPNESIVSKLKEIESVLGRDDFAGISYHPNLEQIFYDRFIVPTSPLFIPLAESRIVGMSFQEEFAVYGPVSDYHSEHVEASYRQAGFEVSDLKGFDLYLSQLAPDALGIELAYLAFLKAGSLLKQEELPSVNKGNNVLEAPTDLCSEHQNDALKQNPLNVYDRFALSFLKNHGSVWMEKAAKVMFSQEDDFYARIVNLAACVAKLDKEYLEATNIE